MQPHDRVRLWTYFTRLWCVYELATFAKDVKGRSQLPEDHPRHIKEINEAIILLSPEWLPWWHPFNRGLTQAELTWLADFGDRRALPKPADRATVLHEMRIAWHPTTGTPQEKSIEERSEVVMGGGARLQHLRPGEAADGAWNSKGATRRRCRAAYDSRFKVAPLLP